MTTATWICATIWAVACSLVSAALLAFHVIALPVSSSTALEQAIEQHTPANERASWRMVHVLYQRCTCSKRIIEHLVGDARPAGLHERVVLVDAAADTRARLERAGFVVDAVNADQLQRDWHAEAAPMFVVVDPRGRVRYQGGYTTAKQGPVIEDTAIFERVRRGDDVGALPLFGCAVSEELKRAVDPLGLQRLLRWRPFDGASRGKS